MQFTELSSYFSRLEKTTSRNEKTQVLAQLFSKTSVSEIRVICYLSLGRLVPLYESLEFQLAEKMVIRVLAQAFAVSEETVRKEFKSIGDLGEVAEKFKRLKAESKRGKEKISVLEVYKRLRTVAEESGEGSQQRKVDGLASILQELDLVSAKFVVRMVVRKLRLGFSDVTILDALSWMKTGDKSMRDRIEKAYFVRADIGEIAAVYKKKGLAGFKGISVELGVPVMPALCQRLKTADEMIKKMGLVGVEPKFDGQRVQIHLKAGKQGWIKAFTRNLEEVAYMFPELKEINSQVKAKEVVLDSEAVGFDAKTGKILPFQQIITRKRKHAIGKAAKAVPLRFYVFDILLKDGDSLLNLPLSKRVSILDKVVKGSSVLLVTERIVTGEADKLRRFHKEQLRQGLEGAVVKKWDDHYIPGRRGWSWVKFKESEESAAGLSDTLDCVVMGYYRGRGKRAEFGIGGFLVGARNEEEYLTVSKIGTGLTDDQWREIKRRADEVIVDKKPSEYANVEKNLVPDFWVAPSIIVEIAADNITKSPIHSAGLALRFPRLVRFRDDKRPEQATSSKELLRLYKMQG